MTFRRSAATLFLLAAVAVPTAALATIAPFKVNSTDDTAGQDCTNPANTCTLRGALAQAAALGAAQEIDLPGVPNTGDVTTYTVGSPLATITNNDITIVGNSQATTIIKSSGGTIFNLTGGSLTLSHAEITGASSGEGIVSSNANVTLDDVLLDGNTRTAVHVSGSPPQVIPTLTLKNSTVSNNSTFNGGVVWTDFATVIATNDLFDTNTSTGGGSAFFHHGSGSVTITGSTFNNNKTTNGGSGAAIGGDNGTSLGIQSCTFTNNKASGNGGAVDVGVTSMTIDNSTFDSNTAGDATHPASGGGLFTGYNVTITRSTFSNNSATQLGGGAFTGGNDGTMITATNCTFSGNTAGLGGGGLATGGGSGQLILSNVTIANNTATTGGGGGVQINFGASIFKNTIIAGNTGSPGPDCNGTMITEDYNLVGNGTGCQINPANGLGMPHDLVGTAANPIDAGLDPMGLMANGSSGPKTLALTPSSPAGDAANPNGCRDHNNIPITTDERGDSRPVDGNCDNVARCDIGAFEAAQCTLTSPTTTTTTSTTTSTTTTSTSTTATTSSSTTTTHAPPTTTSTTTSTTTTSSTTTTHAPTTTTSPTTTTTASSSTTTTHGPTTTTTLPAGDCDSEPVAATFASIDCRLVALLARVTTESDLGASGPKLVQNLSSAKAAEEAGASACAASDLKHASHGLRQAIRDMIGYAHHLQTLRARKNLPGALRTDLLAAGNPITDDAESLKRTVQCPADAPQ